MKHINFNTVTHAGMLANEIAVTGELSLIFNLQHESLKFVINQFTFFDNKHFPHKSHVSHNNSFG